MDVHTQTYTHRHLHNGGCDLLVGSHSCRYRAADNEMQLPQPQIRIMVQIDLVQIDVETSNRQLLKTQVRDPFLLKNIKRQSE